MLNDILRHKSRREILLAIKETSPVKNFRQGMLSGHVCRLLSPYCSVFFIKHGISPNKVTLCMIGFGILGSIMFAIPNVWCKILGYILWFLWFTMDLSDGEVARTTKAFSKYGTEMDYMAHLIDHPFMNIAIWLTFIEIGKWDSIFISFIFLISISCEMYMRNCFAFGKYLQCFKNIKSEHLPSIAKYLYRESNLYPNLIIFFTPLLIIDYHVENGFSLYIYLFWFVSFTINTLRYYWNRLLLFFKG